MTYTDIHMKYVIVHQQSGCVLRESVSLQCYVWECFWRVCVCVCVWERERENAMSHSAVHLTIFLTCVCVRESVWESVWACNVRECSWPMCVCERGFMWCRIRQCTWQYFELRVCERKRERAYAARACSSIVRESAHAIFQNFVLVCVGKWVRACNI